MRQAMLLLLPLLAVLSSSLAVASRLSDRTRPVMLIPGFASSQLHAWNRRTCIHAFQKNLYRDVNIGDRIWIDSARILAQSDCWVSCMKLHIANQTEIECKLRAADGLSGISELDPGIISGPLSTVWGGIIKDLIEHFEFGPDQIMVASYDWRLPPAMLQERDQFFHVLKHRFEFMVARHGHNGGVVVIAHSMGNSVFRYFLAWLKLEVGANHWQEWIDKHISAFFAVGAPLLGSPQSIELLTSGITEGLPVSQKEIRKLVMSFGAILSFFPMPSPDGSPHNSDVYVSVAYKYSGKEDRVKNYTSVEIASGEFFRDLAEHDPAFAEVEEVRKRFYQDDKVLNHYDAWERPPIANVYTVYGVNMPTAYRYEYEDTSTEAQWYQVKIENENANEQVCNKTGDGTVPYHSLAWAHTWLGEQGTNVNVTHVPQSVYFSVSDTKRFEAVRVAKTHQADYARSNNRGVCPNHVETPQGFFTGLFGYSARNHITFFEQTVQENGKQRSTGVWEIEGAGHREILSNPAFLRELRAELRNTFDGESSDDKTSRPPVVDSDCYWNYRQAKCEFPEFCEYRYSFGDVILDQSCRVRRTKKPADTSPETDHRQNASPAQPYCTTRCSYCVDKDTSTWESGHHSPDVPKPTPLPTVQTS